MDSQSEPQHIPVMLEEAVDSLVQHPSGTYIDATYGAGGHSKAILDRLSKDGRLIAIDKDASIQANASCKNDDRFELYQADYSEIEQVLAACKVEKVDGILMDLGISSMQVDESTRGFSFLKEGPLDMRMDQTKGLSLKEKLAKVRESDLAYLIKNYGDERHAGLIAKRIIHLRNQGELNTTSDLASVCGSRHKGIHPATRLFLALRIWVNDELGNLEKALNIAAKLLNTGGRLVVLTFHSIEDSIVKHFIGPRTGGKGPLQRLEKARKPDRSETTINRRARSAMLRVAYLP